MLARQRRDAHGVAQHVGHGALLVEERYAVLCDVLSLEVDAAHAEVAQVIQHDEVGPVAGRDGADALQPPVVGRVKRR